MAIGIVRATELVEQPMDLRPHVVLLGAGASLAALPTGDANARRLPLMSDFAAIVGLSDLLSECGFDPHQNFEQIYSRLVASSRHQSQQRALEQKIRDYFSALVLPTSATHYDRLLLSLRPKDAIFTFNWDPFLFDAYSRNRSVAPLPGIFFLHGNVRIGACTAHGQWGQRETTCPECGAKYTQVPLLYPIEQKDYSSSEYIAAAWNAATDLFGAAFTITIFGYGAPRSDADAVNLLNRAWLAQSKRQIEHVEVIDVADVESLATRWKDFTPTHHFHAEPRFEGSRLWRWPRRSCESLLYPMTEGRPCEDLPLPNTDALADLQRFVAGVAAYEQ
jgi:hypothetical protein